MLYNQAEIWPMACIILQKRGLDTILKKKVNQMSHLILFYSRSRKNLIFHINKHVTFVYFKENNSIQRIQWSLPFSLSVLPLDSLALVPKKGTQATCSLAYGCQFCFNRQKKDSSYSDSQQKRKGGLKKRSVAFERVTKARSDLSLHPLAFHTVLCFSTFTHSHVRNPCE